MDIQVQEYIQGFEAGRLETEESQQNGISFVLPENDGSDYYHGFKDGVDETMSQQ